MTKNEIGTNAGAIWHCLAEHRGWMAVDEIISCLSMTAVDVMTAIGWLAREDKVEFSRDGNRVYLVAFCETYY